MKIKLNFSGQTSTGLAQRTKMKVGFDYGDLTDRMKDCREGHTTRKANCTANVSIYDPSVQPCFENSRSLLKGCLKEWAGLTGDKLDEAYAWIRLYFG